MAAWSPGSARTFLLFGIALALAGLALVLLVAWHLLLGVAASVPTLDFRPRLPPEALIDPYASLPVFDILSKMNGLQLALAYAASGALMTALGVLVARRQVNLLRAAKRWRQDAMRRVRQYRESSEVEASHAEAVVGSGARIGKDPDWISPAHDRGAALQEGVRRTG